jgi:hypothetical protein
VGEGIMGYYGVAESGKPGSNRPVSFKIHVDGQPLSSRILSQDAKTHWFFARLQPTEAEETEVIFTIDAKNVRHRHFCFYAQMVDAVH